MHRWFFPAILLALASLGIALGENFAGTTKSGKPDVAKNIVGTGDYTDAQTAAFRPTISVVDTLTTAGILATTEFMIEGRQGLIVSPRFSASGANCKIRIAYVHKTTRDGSSSDTTLNILKGYSDERTLTAASTQYEASYYPAPDEFFDGEGAIALRVLVTQAPSSGNVTFWVGSK
jgi:hypothetical protein